MTEPRIHLTDRPGEPEHPTIVGAARRRSADEHQLPQHR
jgi:hypothetical protein